MFESLDEQMKADDEKSESSKARYVRWMVGALCGLAVLVVLFFGVKLAAF